MHTVKDNPPVIPPEMRQQMAETQASQAVDDKAGLLGASATRPGPVRDAWKTTVPDIKEGPYTIRRFKDGDILRLDELGHPINSQKAMYEWAANPVASGPDCWLLLWLMTRPIEDVKRVMTEGKAKIEAEQFADLDGYQLALLTGKVGQQMAIYLGAQLSYEALPQEGQLSPPPLSAPASTV